MAPKNLNLLMGKDRVPAKKEDVPPHVLQRARKQAEKRGIKADDDYDALQLLLREGVDLLAEDQGVQRQHKPLTLRLPKNEGTPADIVQASERLKEIARIQRDLVMRRRRRLGLLLAKLAFFVALPTFIVGWYYYNYATPMYVTHSEFVIQKASPTEAVSGFSGLFGGTALATSQDSIVVQGYLGSREAMQRLDADFAFRDHFSAPAIDALQRLAPAASDEDAYELYQDMITIGFDPTEGILRMSVVAASAEKSQSFANALIGYAEERVDQISQRAREDQMSGAKESYDDAEMALFAAQQRLVELQGLRGVLSSDVEVTSQMSIINSLELELEGKRLEQEETLSNVNPNRTRAALNEAEIARLESRIATLRAQMTENSETSTSLASIAGELRLAETDVVTRQFLLQQAVTQMETARIEANRQVRYLAMGVAPVAADVPTLPRKFENTALSFVIFGGLYLLVSLTVSILREQVSV